MSGQFPDNNNRDINNVKRSLKLNLSQHNKKNLTLPLNQDILQSPDLHKLKVGTPELENMILNTNMTQTPTPSLMFPRNVTMEQENFAGGFVQALNNLHNNNSQQDNMGFSGSDSNTSSIFNDSGFIPQQIKEEPQTVPNMNNSPPMSPVDMEYQERMKLERKRQRNRLAASKCRSRKLERISKLEDKVKLLKNENGDLSNVLNQLKENVSLLKLEVLEHNKSGCQLNLYS